MAPVFNAHHMMKLGILVILSLLACRAVLGQSYTVVYDIQAQMNFGDDEEVLKKYRNGHLEGEVIIRYKDGCGMVETHRPPRADSLKHLWLKVLPSYFDSNKGLAIKADNISDKEFAVESDLRDFEWKFMDPKKQIGKYVCHCAWNFDTIPQNVRTVYYATDLPIPITPDGYSTLPGIVLEMERITPRGKFVLTLKEIREGVDDPSLISAARVPGERITEEKFKALKAKRAR